MLQHTEIALKPSLDWALPSRSSLVEQLTFRLLPVGARLPQWPHKPGFVLLATLDQQAWVSDVRLLDHKDWGTVSPRLDVERLCAFIACEVIDDVAAEAFGRRLRALANTEALNDPVVQHLCAAVLPLLRHPDSACPLLLERLGLALVTHLSATYGRWPEPLLKRGRLSRSQEMRSKAMLLGSDGQGGSVAQAAAACGLSPGHFIRAFRATSGQTPYQWLLDQRIDMAKALLEGQMPIADIALRCGFSDQSHFTRIFTRTVGIPPGSWRRRAG